VVDSLIFALALAEETPDWRSKEENKKELLFKIEDISKVVEKELRTVCIAMILALNYGYIKNFSEIATAIRQLKQYVLLPRDESQGQLAAN